MVAQHADARVPHMEALPVPGVLKVQDAERALAIGAGQDQRDRGHAPQDPRQPPGARERHDDRQRHDISDPGAPRVGAGERGKEDGQRDQGTRAPSPAAADRDRGREGGEEEHLPPVGQRMPHRAPDAVRKMGAGGGKTDQREDRGGHGRDEEHRDRAARDSLVARVVGGDRHHEEEEPLRHPRPASGRIDRERGSQGERQKPGERGSVDRRARPPFPAHAPDQQRERRAEHERDGDGSHRPRQRRCEQEEGDRRSPGEGVRQLGGPRGTPPSSAPPCGPT